MSSPPGKDDDLKKDPEITVEAIPQGAAQDGGPPVPPGHSRFYCEKCRTVSRKK